MQADFEGFYARFETNSKKDAGILMGADTLVGDEFTFAFADDNHSRASILNKFGKSIGYFNEATSRQLKVLQAKGWSVRLILSFIAYSDHPEPGCYWGQMAVLSYPKECEGLFRKFCDTAAAKIADGKRVDVNIGVQGVKSIVETNGEWFTDAKLPKVELDSGTVMMKKERSLSEKLVEQGRKKNPGCYVVSWAFIVAVLVGAFFLLKSCVGF